MLGMFFLFFVYNCACVYTSTYFLVMSLTLNYQSLQGSVPPLGTPNTLYHGQIRHL